MKKIKLLIVMTLFTAAGIAGNPLLESYNTPHASIPFDRIRPEHYLPAFREAMKQQREEVAAICRQTAPANFANTIEALEKSGSLLRAVGAPFFNLLSAETNDDLQAVAREVSPLITEHKNSITLNEELFARVQQVYDQKDRLKLSPEQQTLLENTYQSFVRNGVKLSGADKERYRELSKKLSLLNLQFGQNSLKETNAFRMHIRDKKTLAGLPDNLLETLAENARKDAKDGWIIDLKATTYFPLMKYAENRDLRREIYMAYSSRCMTGSEFDNRDHVREIVNTRLEIARLLGYKNYADYVLTRRMAGNKEQVYDLLDKLHAAYRPAAEQECADLQAFADSQGAYFPLQAWDWNYYSEKFRSRKFELNDEVLRPYFELEAVKKGVFGLAGKLYGLRFCANPAIPVYHPEVTAYEVSDAHGKFVGLLYTDFHPREGKRAGAWMNTYKDQWMEGRKDSRPHITIVMNFTRPTADKPALLTYDELTTFLHEFGHALHGLLSKVTYASLAGTGVYRDFVELPSQLLENWAPQQDFLDTFARHYQTGEKIPSELIRKILEAENFNTGYLCLRQLSFAYLDMAWHTLEKPFEGDVMAYEKQAMEAVRLLPVVDKTAMSPTFGHIFSGGYAAGYYSYKWSEVLDADAFSVFEKQGLFDRKTADSFRRNILERGGSENPALLYKRFRGQDPSIDALLKRNGIKK